MYVHVHVHVHVCAWFHNLQCHYIHCTCTLYIDVHIHVSLTCEFQNEYVHVQYIPHSNSPIALELVRCMYMCKNVCVTLCDS